MTIDERIQQLDEVCDAVWAWEEQQHGPHPDQFRGGPVFEAVMALQESLLVPPPDVIDTVHVIYPEDTYVPAIVIIGWAHDVLVNDAVDEHVKVHGLIPDGPEGEILWATIAAGCARPDLRTAMDVLSDKGSHTFSDRPDFRDCVIINRLQDHPALRRLGRKCFPKKQHDTLGAAEAQVRSLTKRGLEKTQHIHSYRCPDCGKYHVGTTLLPKKEKRDGRSGS